MDGLIIRCRLFMKTFACYSQQLFTPKNFMLLDNILRHNWCNKNGSERSRDKYWRPEKEHARMGVLVKLNAIPLPPSLSYVTTA